MKPYTIQDLSDAKLQTSQPLKALMVQSSCRLRLPVFCRENAEKGIEPPDRIAHNMVDRSLMIFKRWWLWIAWSLTIALVMNSPNKNQELVAGKLHTQPTASYSYCMHQLLVMCILFYCEYTHARNMSSLRKISQGHWSWDWEVLVLSCPRSTSARVQSFN